MCWTSRVTMQPPLPPLTLLANFFAADVSADGAGGLRWALGATGGLLALSWLWFFWSGRRGRSETVVSAGEELLASASTPSSASVVAAAVAANAAHDAHDAEDRWRLAVVGLNVGIWEYDFTTRAAFFSHRWKEMLGYGPDELGDQREEVWSRIHPDDRAEVEAVMQAYLGGRSAHSAVECRMRCKGGHYKWVRSRGQALFDAAGRPLRIVGAHEDIAAIKRAEAALLENIAQYRALFDGSPTPMYVYDRNTLRFVTVNDATVRAYGFTREEFAAMTIFDIRPPEEAERLRAALAAWTPGSARNTAAIWRHRRKDGSDMLVQITSRDHDYGGWPNVLVVAQDVTERHLAQEKLAASEERYRFLMEHSPFGIVEHDYTAVVAWLERLRAEGVSDLATWLDTHPDDLAVGMAKVRVLGINNAGLALIGATNLAEAVANLPRVFASEKIGMRRENFLALWSGQFETEGELTMHAFDGAVRRVYHHWWVPVIGGGPQLDRTQLTLVDLTDIRAAETALAAEREQLGVTLRAMAEGVITTDADGKVLFLNAAAAELTGWPTGEAVGRRIDEVCVLRHEATRAEVPVPVATALTGHRFADLPPGTALLGRAGAQRLVEGRCAPIHDRDSRATGTVLVLRDVTQRARLEADLTRASKLESIGLLAGGIAHDFNNLLTAVMGNLALAAFDVPAGAAAGRCLRDAERGLLRARDLTKQLLTFAKGGEPVLDAINLADVVREAAQFALHGANVRAEFDTAPGLWSARADKSQIGQVVQNLVLNAVQAMSGGGVLHLALRNDTLPGDAARPLAAGDYLRLEIMDHGTGIAPEHLARIFEPYFTTKGTGSGLGLATVYSIMRRHQGHIEVESQPGRGTTFRCWLPATAEVSRPRSDSVAPFMAAPGSAGRLLFMDDEEPIRLVAQALLARLGFAVTVAADGAEAVRHYAEARVRGEPFDLVIMDLTVPGGMGGKEAMGELLAIDPGVRAIVSSGYSSDPVMANHRAHGFRGMVPKPYKLSDLAKAVRAVLEES